MSSAVGSEGPTSSSALLPDVTQLSAAVAEPTVHLELGPVTIILATFIVLVLSLITVGCNSIILAAFYRYKRLRTASNCLLVSLAVSDFGVGVVMPFGTYLELVDVAESGAASSSLCVVPYCILITLCSVSVLVTVAIAVDRLTQLAQPLRYNNIITHSSIEKYIAVFWIYSTAVGLSPLIYPKVVDDTQTYSGGCRFNGVIMPPVRVFLFLAVWAPSAFILLGCYVYVYLVARAHARAIYTVELSFRNQTQTLALPRYGQTLAVTVGAFFILWLPFQTCMLLDTFCGTNILSDCTVWLGLPILAHSGTNPWIYAFHHGEVRVAAGKIAEELVSLFGVTPSGYYGCSPTRRGSHTNLELAEVNNSNEQRRPPVEDCFAAKHHQLYQQPQQPPSLGYSATRREPSSKNYNPGEISPERHERELSSESFRPTDILEENIHDLTKMLDPKFIIDRNHIIDSNHNIDKIKNLKYLLDPTFNKIRHLRRLNHKRISSKNQSSFFHDSRFVSYQNLKMDGNLNRKTTVHLNAMSDPMLNTDDSPLIEGRCFHESARLQQLRSHGKKTANSLASVSDSNIKESVSNSPELNFRLLRAEAGTGFESHRCSEQYLNGRHFDANPAKYATQLASSWYPEHRHKRSFSWVRARQRFQTRHAVASPTLDLKFQQNSYSSLPTPDGAWSTSRSSPKLLASTKQLTITPNRLANLFHREQPPSRAALTKPTLDAGSTRLFQTRPVSSDVLVLTESANALPGPTLTKTRLLEPSSLVDSLQVPAVHSEPPSPMEPLPLDSLQEEDGSRTVADVVRKTSGTLRNQSSPRNLKSPIRHSDPIIPSVLLNIEDYSGGESDAQLANLWSNSPSRLQFGDNGSGPVSPRELSELLLRCAEERASDGGGSCRTGFPDTIFPEHDCTRFSSRRPSDSKWSESSRSQEVLSNVSSEHQRFPSSYSVNNFQTCNGSGSDLNDFTSSCQLEPFMCSAALSSSLRESFFSAPSMPDSEDTFASFEADESTTPDDSSSSCRHSLANVQSQRVGSASTISLVRRPVALRREVQLELQSKSTESMFRDRDQNERLCAILRLEPSIHRSRPRVRPVVSCKNTRLAPLATPTPTDVCTPTFDITVVSDLKSEAGVGVKV